MSDEHPTPRARRDTIRPSLGPYGIITRATIRLCEGDTTAVAVYAALATYANGDGACWPSQATLAADLGVSEGTIRRAIDRLETVGLVTVDARLSRGRKTGNLYVLLIASPDDGSRSSARSVEDTDRAPARDPQTRTSARSLEQTKEADQRTREASPRAPRSRNQLWDALVEVCALDEKQTKTAASLLGKAVRELKDVDATPAEIRTRAARYRALYRGARLTPTALLKHWPSLSRPAGGNEPPDPGTVEREEQRRLEWLEARGMTG